MRKRGRAFRGIIAILLALLAGGCVYTEQTKIVPPITAGFKGESRVDPYLLDHQPQTVAVMPFLNRTDKKEAFDIVRKSFYGHFSRLNYTTMPLFKVDDSLHKAGLDTPEKVAGTSPEKLREILRVDAVIRGDVTHYDRIYAAVYSQVAVGAEVRMFEGKSGKELWWAKDVSRKHAGGISTTPVGLILTAVSTALNLREIELLRSSDDLFRDMVKTLPQPALAQALRPPTITILVHDGMRRSDRYANKVGDVIKVAMEGDPRMRASFRIGDFKKDLSLKEEESGTYAGSYKITPGDNIEDALITGTLTNDAGNSTDWVDVLGAVTIDTTPPEIPKGLRAVGRDMRVDLAWLKNTDKDIARYKIYRSLTPLTGYQEVGATELDTFQDKNLKNEASFYYKISALDLAGNESKPSDMSKATTVSPGPTPVKGMISGEITWYAGASPYIIEGEVIVDQKGVLSIEPGTVIRSKGEGIAVLGKLVARGDNSSLITLETAMPEQTWKGIVFQGTKNEESAIEYVKISGAVVGITCLSSSPVIAHNDISRNQVGIRVSEAFSKPKIFGNSISSNAVAGVEILAAAAPNLEENEIRGNQRDGVLIREAGPFLAKNRILNNGEAGVRLYSSPARLVNNNIQDNGKYEIYNALEKDVNVEAKDNWWGTKDGVKVIGKIFGRVDYQRVLDAPYPQGKSLELSILRGALGGRVDRDSFLTLINSPYVVEKEVAVEKGATLFIEPGVTLKFNPGTSIVVRDGGVDARGTPDRAITFTSNSSSPSPGSYTSAVRFAQSSQLASFFRYCILEYAETGLDIAYGGPEIDHCWIANHSQTGVKVANEAEPRIFFSTFAKNMGTGAVVALGNARPKMNRNNFIDNPFAVQSFSSIYMDARENWWGSSPPKESLFLGEINYKPWLNTPEAGAFQRREP
jgi:parallel beta-helix repeat protein